jgi:hypothetical protein
LVIGSSRHAGIGSRLNQIATSLRSQPGGRHVLLVWLTLVALLLQSFLTQTHVHLASGSLPSSARSQIAAAGVSAERPAPAGHSTCPLCVEMKIAGHYLPPVPFVLVAPPLLAFWFHQIAAVELVRPYRAHHWRSRAPPRQPDI